MAFVLVPSYSNNYYASLMLLHSSVSMTLTVTMSCIPVATSVQMITVAFRAILALSTVILKISEWPEVAVLLTCEAKLKVNEPTSKGLCLAIPENGDAAAFLV